jgi:serine-type D-Ala-D-Ala carboxypeptidase (penicillin-binding protein 5/6)
MPKLPPAARLAFVAVAAGVALGALATTSRLPVAPAGVAAAARPAATSEPGPWFDMSVGSARITLKQPRAMPNGAPPMRARAGILIDMDTGAILWSKQPDLELAPASLTKVLTSLVALENFNPGQEVTITPDALGQSSADTLMHLKAGQTLTVQELLEGMLLPSGDDAASAIAVDTVGEARYVAAMNAQVAALGLTESHFSATAGLDDPGLYSSAHDLAVIADYTYQQFPLFDRIVDTRAITLPASAQHPDFHLHNLDALLQDYPAAVGVKPGWTGNAGACMIGIAVRGGHHLLAVLLSANYPARLESRLFDWGFQLDGLAPLLPPAPTLKPARAA